MTPVSVARGSGPVILAQPHSGTFLPRFVLGNLNEEGQKLADTDWHVPALYDGLLDSATTVRATFHRYVVDPNRDPAGGSLYPDQNTTGLIPACSFDGKPIWRIAPGADDTASRVVHFHQPYHDALAAEIGRVRRQWGMAVVYDCHSIRSQIPFLFSGRLPDLNIGTNGGVTCAPELDDAVLKTCEQSGRYSVVSNGRFRGGWTTRHYGQPENHVHALQMEIAQRCYLKSEAPPFDLDPTAMGHLRQVLSAVLSTLDAWARQQTHQGHVS